MTMSTILVVLSLLLTFTTSAASVVLACFARPRQLRWPVLLAMIALIVSTMGLTTWTPFGFFPEVGWTNGEVSLRSKWLFFIPLALGSTALIVVVVRRKSSSEY